MILVLAYCHKDIDQTERLLRWIGFLSSQNGWSMKKESLLLVASQHAARRKKTQVILWLATKLFGQARFHVPEIEYEKGWPASANFMFEQSLMHVERHGLGDIFFLEPDAIPVVATWWDVIKAEWAVAREHGKYFMGALVPHNVPHMTGVAAYAQQWRQAAPTLVGVPDNGAWDCEAAAQVLPNAHMVDFIQHEWRKPRAALEMVKSRTVLYHQDKKGELFAQLDARDWGNACIRNYPAFNYNSQESELMSRKFYYTENANRVIKSQGYDFQFDPYEQLGGAWRGTFVTADEGQIVALDSLVSANQSVSELSQEDWEARTKKKAPTRDLPNSEPSRMQPVAIKSSPAVLVENPEPPLVTGVEKGAAPVDIASVLQMGEVDTGKPVVPAKAKTRPRREKKNPPPAPANEQGGLTESPSATADLR